MTTISLPGPIGLAPAGTNAPPDARATAAGATGDGNFAGVMAAAEAEVSTQGTGTPTTGESPTSDLAQLLFGLQPAAGGPGATGAEGIAAEIADTVDRIRPDRLAGVERDEHAGLRVAYEALMSTMLVPAPVITPDDVARAIDGVASAASAAGAGTTDATGELTQLLREPGANAGPASAATLTDAGTVSGAPSAAVASATTAAMAPAPGTTSATAERARETVDVAGMQADPGRAPARPVQQTQPAQQVQPAPQVQVQQTRQAQPVRATGDGAGLAIDAAGSPLAARIQRALTEQTGDTARGESRADGPLAARPAGPAAHPLAGMGDAGQAPAVTDAAVSAAPLPAARPAALVAQLADTVQRATLSGDNELRLVLNPPELGHLTVRIQDSAQGVRIAIDASSPAARDLIQQHLPALHSALEARDLRVERLDVRHTDPSLGEQALDGNRSGPGFQGHARQGQEQSDRPTWSPVAAMDRAGGSRGAAGAGTGGAVGATERARPTANARAGSVDLLA